MRISAKNQLKGTITAVHPGSVNAEVVIELPCGQELTAIVTMGSVESLELNPGMEAVGIIKASHVIVGVE